MNDDRSVERAARSWIETGPTQAPDRVVERALLTIETTRQERDLGIPWRFPIMTTPARVAAAAVTIVLLVGGAFALTGRLGQGAGGLPASTSPSPIASGSPSLVPSASASLTAEVGPLPARETVLPAGTYVAAPFVAGRPAGCMDPPQPGCSESMDDSIRATFTVPAGWGAINGTGVWLSAEKASAPNGASMGFGRGSWLHSDPCLTEERIAANGARPDVPVGPTANDFAQAIADHPLFEATDPVAVTLGGYSGMYVDLQLPSDLAGCKYYFPWEPGIYAQGPSHRWHLWILDVDAVRVVVQTTDYAGTSAEHRAQLRAMIESIQIEP